MRMIVRRLRRSHLIVVGVAYVNVWATYVSSSSSRFRNSHIAVLSCCL